MDTKQRIYAQLTQGELKLKAAELATEHDVDVLAVKIKALYESMYGAVRMDITEWRDHAHALKNPGGTHAAALTVPTSVAPSPEPSAASSTADGTATGAFSANKARPTPLEPVSRSADGTPQVFRSAPERGKSPKKKIRASKTAHPSV